MLFCKLKNILQPLADLWIVLPAVRTKTTGAILDTVFCIVETAATAVAKGIERTKAEQAAEAFGIRMLVTGKVFTGLVLKKVMSFHGSLLFFDTEI